MLKSEWKIIMINLKGLFKGKKGKKEPSAKAEGAEAGGIAAEGAAADENPGRELSKKELKAEKKTEKAVAKAAKKAEKEAKKAEKKAKKPAKPPKAKQPPKPKKPPKPPKPPKIKLTKEEKIQLKRDRLIAKTKLKVEKLRAKAAKKAEKIRIKQERVSEKKRLKREFKAEKKRFKKELRDEIRQAKREMPKSNLPKIIIPVFLVILLISSAVASVMLGVGPLASFKMPELPGFIKNIGDLKPLEKLRSVNPLSRSSEKGNAEEALVNMFDSLIALDFKEAEKFTDMSALVVPEGYLELVSSETVMNCTFDRLSYTIVSGLDEISDTEFEVKADITAVYIKPLMAKFIKEYLQMTYEASTTQSQSMIGIAGTNSFFAEFAAAPGLATINNEITIKIALTDGSWKVVPDNNLINALFGGVIIVAGDFFSDDPFVIDSSAPQEGSSSSH